MINNYPKLINSKRKNMKEEKNLKKVGMLVFYFSLLFCSGVFAQQRIEKINIDWNNITCVSKTTPTLQLVENPKVRPFSPICKPVFAALKNLKANYLRYVPWCPYPKLSVAELKAPTKEETYWNFSYMDSTVAAVVEASEGRPVVLDFSTTPVWMWKTESEISYPEDPYQVCWNYNKGTELRDTTVSELADYYGRMLQWYTKGGFTDEIGIYHKSGHYYNIDYWEVLNEPDGEHLISPELYTKIYDAIVLKLKNIQPDLKFIGLSLMFENNPHYFEYFLNPKNHQPGVPLDGISYHLYSQTSYKGQNIEAFQYTCFEKANAFLNKVRYIENIRKRLSPHTITMINEIGTMISQPIPLEYWNLSGAMYAHVFLELTKIGIDVAGESQLVGYPTQYPDVSMVNWETGKPNSRYWVLKLLIDNFGPGDKLVSTNISTGDVQGQGIITKEGNKLLLINKKNKSVSIQLPLKNSNKEISYVDMTTGENSYARINMTGNLLELRPFSVAVISLKQ